ncbi:MAG: phosphoribosylamine--glycine ligase [Thermodesulfobacteriota bacterium]|jgi:phosphoribosylamine--glycine ligase|nr:MAG: phosphoribosylamine--glycine ligase [Thermodesulfobacteriota bacterium]
MKKVFVIGSGGREHTIVWKLSSSPQIGEIFCAPGNAGISRQAQCVPIPVEDIPGLADFAEKESIDLTVVGPEVPLTMGIVDIFQKRGLIICGPNARAAELEGSKAFAKEFMKKYNIPTADHRTFSDPEKAKEYVKERCTPLVVKADGLAAGKGVMLAITEQQARDAIDLIMIKKDFGTAGNKVVIEEFLLGEEASFLAFTDGETVVPMPSSQDHKAIYDGDQGPNTGGMGAYSPAPVVTSEISEKVMKKIMIPTIKGMAAEGRKYRGILYAGLMIDKGEPWVLEFNTRFGDPETQPLLVKMKNDLLPVLEATITGNLKEMQIEWDARPAVCVVMASSGYPGKYEKGKIISGLEAAEQVKEAFVFHAGTAWNNGKIVTNGGRVLGVTALGNSIQEAINQAYKAVSKITWEGVYHRKDIGSKALKRK